MGGQGRQVLAESDADLQTALAASAARNRAMARTIATSSNSRRLTAPTVRTSNTKTPAIREGRRIPGLVGGGNAPVVGPDPIVAGIR